MAWSMTLYPGPITCGSAKISDRAHYQTRNGDWI